MRTALICAVLCTWVGTAYSQATGHFKVRTDNFVQIGYDAYKVLSFGASTGTPNNGSWALEHWNGGLNFWKPWPTASMRNYALFLQDHPAFVGIGKQPYQALDINGDVAVYGTLITYSDERLKRDVQPLTPTYCQNVVRGLNTYSYYLKLDRLPLPEAATSDAVKQQTAAGDAAERTDNQQATKLRHGFLAQEVEAVAPQLVQTDPQGYKAIDQQALIPIMLEVIKQQQTDLETLRTELNQLKDELGK